MNLKCPICGNSVFIAPFDLKQGLLAVVCEECKTITDFGRKFQNGDKESLAKEWNEQVENIRSGRDCHPHTHQRDGMLPG